MFLRRKDIRIADTGGNAMTRKGITVGVILLFIGVAAAPGSPVSATEERTTQSTLHLCGLNSDTAVALTTQQAAEVGAICEKYQSQMKNASSLEAAEDILTRVFIDLGHYGLFEGTDLLQVPRLLQNSRVFPRNLVHTRSIPHLFSNIFCFVTATLPWTVEWEFGYMPGVFPIGLSFLSMIPLMAVTENIPLIGDISLFLALLCVLQPVKVMNFVLVFGDGMIHSVGLRGIVDADYTLALLGFTGLIFIQSKLDKVTLIGFSLAMFSYN
jgi:hypothetical protein